MFIVHLRDGKTLTEKDTVWRDLPIQDITSLQLYRGGKHYTISVDGKNVKLIQVKRATLDMVLGTNEITERVIGFIIEDKYAVKMEVDEMTGDVRLTLEKREGRNWIKL